MKMRLAWLLILMALPGLAQFKSIEITFEGIGCMSCIESLPGRVQRMRGVESATVDKQNWILKVQLADQNRVRIEQVRDVIEQDGTKAVSAKVEVRGELSQQDGHWILQPVGLPSSYLIESEGALSAGAVTLAGSVKEMKPTTGKLTIHKR